MWFSTVDCKNLNKIARGFGGLSHLLLPNWNWASRWLLEHQIYFCKATLLWIFLRINSVHGYMKLKYSESLEAFGTGLGFGVRGQSRKGRLVKHRWRETILLLHGKQISPARYQISRPHMSDLKAQYLEIWGLQLSGWLLNVVGVTTKFRRWCFCTETNWHWSLLYQISSLSLQFQVSLLDTW